MQPSVPSVWQVWPCLALHLPESSQVPGQLSVSAAFFTATQVPASHVVHTPLQSSAAQQLSTGMQLPAPQGLYPSLQS